MGCLKCNADALFCCSGLCLIKECDVDGSVVMCTKNNKVGCFQSFRVSRIYVETVEREVRQYDHSETVNLYCVRNITKADKSLKSKA